MSAITADPLAAGLRDYAQRLRAGQTTVVATVEACLQRIDAYDGRLQAWQTLDAERALTTAAALDALLANGHDLGPLMGVPIGVKDIIAVDGLPTTNGSLYPSEALTGPQGTIVNRLKKSGCVILGKTRTVEFALGATGVNEARGTPCNVWDSSAHRVPGGSSSGSAVATAAGLCGFALGTDTGGSVRIPACFNGLYGHKTTVGLWPTDGVFPLSPSLDSIGPLCRSADDACIVHEVITGHAVEPCQALSGLRLGLPNQYYFDDLDAPVAEAFSAAVSLLEQHGAQVSTFDIPESLERETLFPAIVPAELLAALTPAGFEQARARLDSVTEQRAAHGLTVSAVEYTSAQRRRAELEQIALQRFAGLDAWITPTCAMLPATLAELKTPDGAARALQSSRNTQPGNLFGLCAASLPLSAAGTPLPAGLQLLLPGGQDARLLGLSVAMQRVLGTGEAADLSGFLG